MSEKFHFRQVALILDNNFDVIVVGGGLAGLTLATALSERGHPTVVLEARRAITPLKRGMSLAPNGLRVLEKLRLLSEVEGIARRVHRVNYMRSSGELLVAYDYAALVRKPNYLLTFLPHELETFLRQRAEATHVRIQDGASFEGLLQGNGETGVRAAVDGKVEEFKGKVVVGADGGHSKVRAAAKIPWSSRKSNSSYVVTIAGGTVSQDDACHYLARGKMLGSFPLLRGQYLFYYVPTNTLESMKARGIEHLKTQLTELSPELQDGLQEAQSWNDFPIMTPQDIAVKSWVTDGVALVGDAAHAIEPSLGQGASLTLSDVDILIDVLETCLAKNDFSTAALKPYEEARKPQTEQLREMASLTASLMNTSNRGIEWFRDRALRKMQKTKSMGLALEIATGAKSSMSFSDKMRLAGLL